MQTVLLGFGVLRLAQQKEREGARKHTWRMRSSPAKGREKTGRMAPPLAQSSPPGKEGRRAYERREKGPERQSPEREPGGLSMSRARARLPPKAGGSRAEVDQPG